MPSEQIFHQEVPSAPLRFPAKLVRLGNYLTYGQRGIFTIVSQFSCRPPFSSSPVLRVAILLDFRSVIG